MRSFEETKERGNILIVDLLLSDMQLAMTFIDCAEQALSDDEDRRRLYQKAGRAYSTIVKLLERTAISPEQYEALMKRLTVLRGRLDAYIPTQRKIA
jgi:hypothetical protein